MQLFGDIRTRNGGVLRVKRFGLGKMSESAQKAISFPEDHLPRIRDRVLHEEGRWGRRVRVQHTRPVHENKHGRFHGRPETNDGSSRPGGQKDRI